MRELICLCVERDDTNSYRFFALRFRGNFLARLANFRKGQFAQQRARVTLESRLRSNGWKFCFCSSNSIFMIIIIIRSTTTRLSVTPPHSVSPATFHVRPINLHTGLHTLTKISGSLCDLRCAV